jgi:hypothetical protein
VIDLAAKKEARNARIQAKKEMIAGQYTEAAPATAEATK